MPKELFYPVGCTEACRYAAGFLRQQKIPLVDHPTPEVTHLLLDVPAFSDSGALRSGESVEKLLSMLPPSITVIGGNLDHPALSGYRTLDLLKCEDYLCPNAAITAECALQVAAPLMTRTFSGSPVWILGWGRIGKCLSDLLRSLGAEVTLVIRNPKERALAQALGYAAAAPSPSLMVPKQVLVLFNTVPDRVLTPAQLQQCSGCVKIDLASGKWLDGEDVVAARGLPGKYAPESSGKLIARTITRQLKEE